MPVSKVARDMLLDGLISFMKGEINNDEFDTIRSAAVGVARKEGDQSAADVGYLLWFFYDDLVTHDISVTEEEWQLLRRYAAFLRTDLSIRIITLREFHPRQIAALAGLLLLGAGGAWWVVGGSPIPLAASWAIIAAIWVVWPRRRVASARAEEVWRFAPFWGEYRWRQYEPLLDEYQLPDYHANTHHQPSRGKRLGRLAWLHHRAAGVLFLPITLIWNALPTRHTFYSIPLRMPEPVK